MDPLLKRLTVELGEVALRNAASAIAHKIRAVKARKQDRETIAELEEIVNGLLADKSELLRIARAYEQELVAQQISKQEIEYISQSLVPLLEELMSSSNDPSQNSASTKEMMELVTPILSVEVVTILQLLGFNFKKAIGEPLTEMVAQFISSKAPAVAGGQTPRQRPTGSQQRRKR